MRSFAVDPDAARPRSPTPAWRTSSSRAVLRSRSACETVWVSAEMAGRAVDVRTSTASVVVEVDGTVIALLPRIWPVPATWKRSGAVSGAATEWPVRLTPRASSSRVKSRPSKPSRTLGPAAAISWALETGGRFGPPVPPSSWVAASVKAPSASRRAARSPASWAGVRSTSGSVEAYWSSASPSVTLSLSSRSKEFRALEKPSRTPSRRAKGSPSTISRTCSPSAKAESPSGARPSQVRVFASTTTTFWQPTPGPISRRATSVAPSPASATPSSAKRPPPSMSTVTSSVPPGVTLAVPSRKLAGTGSKTRKAW